MDLGGKGFEADVCVELVDDDLFALLDNRRMVGKTHVNNAASLVKGRRHEGLNERFVVIDTFDLKDDIIPHLEIIQDLIQAVHACADPGYRNSHQITLIVRPFVEAVILLCMTTLVGDDLPVNRLG